MKERPAAETSAHSRHWPCAGPFHPESVSPRRSIRKFIAIAHPPTQLELSRPEDRPWPGTSTTEASVGGVTRDPPPNDHLSARAQPRGAVERADFRCGCCGKAFRSGSRNRAESSSPLRGESTRLHRCTHPHSFSHLIAETSVALLPRKVGLRSYMPAIGQPIISIAPSPV